MALAWTPSARLKQAALERAQPLSASLELTYRCNWRCVFCYNPRHRDRRGLAGAEWLAVLDGLRTLGTLYVALTGGEPLAHPEFLAIARGVRERAFVLRILTNGALVTEALADEIAALRPLSVELSVHGATAATHDRATATSGSFDAMLRGVDRLLARRVGVVLKTPLTRLNEAEMGGLRRIADERGVPWRIDPVLTPRDDGDAGPLAYRASAESIGRVFRELAALGQLPREERAKGGTNCGLGRTTVAIDPEGGVFPCLQWRRAPLGNVRETPIAEMWAGSAERLAAASVARAANDRLVEEGGALASFPFCPALALQRTGDPLRPDESHRDQAALAERVRLDPR
ncbi:MAG TPA: radical SAM protein [Vicinamibacteria bacterium]|nr:radical SAM protein [Vicinamibacteria bacterium]